MYFHATVLLVNERYNFLKPAYLLINLPFKVDE